MDEPDNFHVVARIPLYLLLIGLLSPLLASAVNLYVYGDSLMVGMGAPQGATSAHFKGGANINTYKSELNADLAKVKQGDVIDYELGTNSYNDVPLIQKTYDAIAEVAKQRNAKVILPVYGGRLSAGKSDDAALATHKKFPTIVSVLDYKSVATPDEPDRVHYRGATYQKLAQYRNGIIQKVLQGQPVSPPQTTPGQTPPQTPAQTPPNNQTTTPPPQTTQQPPAAQQSQPQQTGVQQGSQPSGSTGQQGTTAAGPTNNSQQPQMPPYLPQTASTTPATKTQKNQTKQPKYIETQEANERPDGDAQFSLSEQTVTVGSIVTIYWDNAAGCIIRGTGVRIKGTDSGEKHFRAKRAGTFTFSLICKSTKIDSQELVVESE